MKRIIRHKRIRAKLEGTAQRPRVAVFRSNRALSAQAIDDHARTTLAHAAGSKTKIEAVATAFAKKVLDAGITKIVFDRGGHAYHGHVKTFAEVLRKEGLDF